MIANRATAEATVAPVASSPWLRRTSEKLRPRLWAMRDPGVEVLYLHFFIVEDGAVLEKYAGFLCDRFEDAGLGGKGRSPGRMGVGGARDIGARGENRLVDVETRPVHPSFAFRDLSVGIDQHHVLGGSLRECRAVPEHPEAVGAFGIAGADVPVSQIAPAERPEHAIASGQFLAQYPPGIHVVHRRPSASLHDGWFAASVGATGSRIPVLNPPVSSLLRPASPIDATALASGPGFV